jgi:hypothetical protein
VSQERLLDYNHELFNKLSPILAPIYNLIDECFKKKMHGITSKEILVPLGRDIVCLRACDNNLERALMLCRIGACLEEVSTTEDRSVSTSGRTEPGLGRTHGNQSM